MSKQRKTLSLCEDNAEWLSQQDNASAFVDNLITQYRNGGGDDDVMLQYSRQEVAAEVEYLKKKLDAKEGKLEYLDERAEEAKPEWQKVVEEAIEVFNGKDMTETQAEHWAGKANLSVEKFREKYNEVRNE
jgi:hypothetical protein